MSGAVLTECVSSWVELRTIQCSRISDEHFYQLGLLQFGTMDRLRLDPPPSLRDLLEVGLQDEPLESNGLRLDDVCTVSLGLPVSFVSILH